MKMHGLERHDSLPARPSALEICDCFSTCAWREHPHGAYPAAACHRWQGQHTSSSCHQRSLWLSWAGGDGDLGTFTVSGGSFELL